MLSGVLPPSSPLRSRVCRAQTWGLCRFYDHYRRKNNFSGHVQPAAETRRCDAQHRYNLQPQVEAAMPPAANRTPVDLRFEPHDCTLGPFDAHALLHGVGVNNTIWSGPNRTARRI